MEEQNKNDQSQASLDNEVKQVPYFPASDDCGDLGAVVPKNFAMEQKNFNNILRANFDVSKFVMNRLGYKNIDVFCQAFAKEQIDAIATAIYNFERNGFGLIVSDQTGLGKGRVVAGLIRYAIYHLNKVPVFWTEKPTLFSDIYRDLIDIKFDVGVPIQVKKTTKVDGDSLEESDVIKLIKADISDSEELRIEYEFEADFDLNEIFNEDNGEMLDDIIEKYREHLSIFGFEDESSYEKVSAADYRKQISEAIAEGRSLIEPFSTTAVKIKDKEGNILYDVKAKDIKEAIRKEAINTNVKLVMMTYSQIRRTTKPSTGELTPKFKLIQKLCNDSILILDESHNAAGRSNTFRTMANILLSAKDVVYVSATWAKRPDNMPLYALRTSMKEAFLSAGQLANAFENGDLALQEVVSSALVKTGQLVRRERTFKGETTYYYADPDSENPEERETGNNQINKIDRVAAAFNALNQFEAHIRDAFKKIVKQVIVDDTDEQKKYKFSGGFARSKFLLFNYFLLGIKVHQATKQAISQLKSGRKVIIAIANTLESAFSNIKVDYRDNTKYQLGDVIQNDFSLILKYMMYHSIQYKYRDVTITDRGVAEEENIHYKPLEFTRDQQRSNEDGYKIGNRWLEYIESYIQGTEDLLNTQLGIPLSPIDQIKQMVKKQGFTIEEITGRTKALEFIEDVNGNLSFDQGVLSKREKAGSDRDIINMFNFNEIDALIINQSGSTGVSMHAVPTTDKNGKLIAPVNIVPTNPPISLLPKNEVKQRCMIIMQMELDINREIQKLGRVERSGQVFPPIYKYIFSAIPSESRLAAMMQRKLKSLMANTKGGQEQGKDLFNADDLFNNIAVDPWNLTVEEIGLGSLYTVANAQDIYKKTSLFYFLPYYMQKDFFDSLSRNLRNHIEYLKSRGLYFGEVTFREYAAKTTDIIPYIIGNNNALTDFGRHTFAELAEVTEFDEKNTESSVRKAITNNLTINKDKETFVYNDLEEYVSEMKKSIEEMVDDYNLLQGGYISAAKRNIDSLESDKKTIEDSLTKYPNLEAVVGVREKIDQQEKKKQENTAKISQLISESTEEGLKNAALITRENQQIDASITQLVKSERDMLKEITSVEELRRLYAQASSSISYYNDEIEKEKKRIDKRENVISEQNEYKDLMFNYLNQIGFVYDVKTYSETIESQEDSLDFKYVYTVLSEEKEVLVGVRFNFNNNDHFTPSQIELKLMSVTDERMLQANYFLPIKNESEKAQLKQPLVELSTETTGYVGFWDSYISTIYTGKQVQKVMLSGNLMRGLAFNYMVGASGTIVKYNTYDGKLRTSLVLNQESTQRVLARFNEGVDYPLLMDLTKDNFERMFVRGIAKCVVKNFKVFASQILFDAGKTFMLAYPNDELKDKLESMIESYANNKFLSYNDALESDDVLQIVEKEIRENQNKLIITISSQSQDMIKQLDNVVANLGSENAEDYNQVQESSNMSYVVEAFVYTQKKKTITPKIKGESFVSPVQLRYSSPKYFLRPSTNLLEDVFIIDNSLISERASVKTGDDFFVPIWNITMNFDLLEKMIEFLEAKYVRILATTSKGLLDKATPAYVFDIEESSTGSIDYVGSQSIEGVAENTIEAIEDVLTEFIELYQK